jgi:hypothetical protein
VVYILADDVTTDSTEDNAPDKSVVLLKVNQILVVVTILKMLEMVMINRLTT